MTLRDFVDEVASDSRTLTVYAPEPDEALERHFEARQVAVEHEPIPDDGSGGFVVVTAQGEFVGSLGATAVRELILPSVDEWELGPNESIRVPMNLLADTTFVSFDARQLLVATREIEDRAYRRGRGTLRAGFQSLARLSTQCGKYETLSGETELDVHVYGRPDADPDLPRATIHGDDAEEIASHWFVVFDGGGDDRQACALLAEEVADDPRSFRGFWTYDPGTVADVDGYLRETYGSERAGKR
ncbi:MULTISPECIES: DICT sensory domain-containing protein [Halorussus]|uniref:DICT sensory domain-containing protein n=1 Tax=Halorussus TaxID=1070314 RepID=UPI000E211018|nr:MULTISPECIES: DICT sensory domain-containing protein [Halorussus]NHN59498.1 sensor protein [Halorussus sp. JP-T4]